MPLTHLLKKLKPYLYEIPQGAVPGMKVPARFYISKELLEEVASDRSIDQLVNVSMLPGVVEHVLAMPDMHEGYGFPIGGVAATLWPKGIISPGGVGYDINCGVRLLVSELSAEDIAERVGETATELMRAIPSGVGRGGRIKLSSKEMDAVLAGGMRWCREKGMADADDLAHAEENGCLAGADPGEVSERAKTRGRDQLGTIGSGNHFLEIQRVDRIFDRAAAAAFGLEPDRICIMVHCGSRGLGHQVCTDYVREMLAKLPRYGFSLPDMELACAPADSPEGRRYLKAMSAAANFAWANRQVITHHCRLEWLRLFGSRGGLKLLYDVCHNIAKVEEHDIRGSTLKLIVHRKGATRSFGPGREEIPEVFRGLGQPVIIPGTMGTSSYILCGTEPAMRQTFGTVCHGAGRRMSRHAAKREVSGRELRGMLEKSGISVRCFSDPGLAEEAPLAYKDVEAVVGVVEDAGLAKRVARLRPVAVIKGE